MNTDTLKTTLVNLSQTGTQSNPALNSLLNDYANYHLALLPIGGFFTLVLLVSSLWFLIRFFQAPRANKGWTFEKKTMFAFAGLSGMVGLLMALLVAVNAETASAPQKGFIGLIGELRPIQAIPQRAERYTTFQTWLESGSATTPRLIQNKINQRIGWQLPKAVISGVLLIALITLSIRIWSALIWQSRAGVRRTLKEHALLFSGVAAVPVGLVLMLMVLGNTQASFAPLGLILMNG